MQAELRAANPELNIEILGVNMVQDAPYNPLVTAVRTLPWLQATAQEDPWDSWGVTWRDVRILDSQNRLKGILNLTAADLRVPSNYLALKEMFLDVARVVDTDGDHLPDDWEQKYFTNLLATASEDPDQDHYDNLAEFAFGTSPIDARSVPVLRPVLSVQGSDSFLTLSFRRRAGGFLNYQIEASSDLLSWTGDATEVGALREPLQFFDGSGTMETYFGLTRSTALRASGYLRVQVTPR